MSELGSETDLVWEKERKKNKSSVMKMPKKMVLLDSCSYSLFVIIFPVKKNQNPTTTTKHTHKLCGYGAFEQTKQHVWSLQPGCQGIRKAEILSLGN